MSVFVREHVKRVFDRAGYGLLKLDGDRHGIVQGDGLYLTVAPYIEAAARRFSSDEATVDAILSEAVGSRPLKFDLYGGSVSVDLEGIYLPDEFIEFLKDECRETYYQAQRDVDAIFDSEDPPEGEWDEARHAYVGVADEFAAEAPEGERLFVRVLHIADQSFNAYESGEEEYDARDAADIIEGRTSHGSVEVQVHRIGPDEINLGEATSGHGSAFDANAYDPDDFDAGDADAVYAGQALSWTNDGKGAHLLDLAAEIVADEGDERLAKILKARAVELGLPALENGATEAAAPTI